MREESAPLMVTIPHDALQLIYESLSMGQEYAKEVIVENDKRYGRGTIRVRKAAEQTEIDREMILGAQELAAKYLA